MYIYGSSDLLIQIRMWNIYIYTYSEYKYTVYSI